MGKRAIWGETIEKEVVERKQLRIVTNYGEWKESKSEE